MILWLFLTLKEIYFETCILVHCGAGENYAPRIF